MEINTKEELIQALIRLVIERADTSRGNFGRGYFLLNIQHPVILDLYNRYKRAHGIPYDCPMGDGDRLNFELSLFNGGTLREIAAWCRWRQGELEQAEERKGSVNI